mgnify:CR=1 FL=1
MNANVARYERLLRYELAIHDAHDHLIDFARFVTPHKKLVDDPSKSEFLPARHLEKLADLMESVERKEITRVIVSMPPRHGKTTLATEKANAWISGRNPEQEIMTATYGQTNAKDFSTHVQEIIRSQRFRQVFPDYYLVKANDERLINHLGKSLFFLGRRSPTTGRGGNWLLVDDPIKDDKDARSPVLRDDAWEWFRQTLFSRRHDDRAPVVVTATRWNEDDITGRITDKTNPKYSREFGEGWEVLNLPALAEEDDPLGRKPGEALWPERFGARDLARTRAGNEVAFSALYQGNPSPAEGVFYMAADLHTYEARDLPTNLRMFAASDHAVSTEAQNDPSCMGVFGVDPRGVAYIMPDLVWRKIDASEAVEQMIRLMRKYAPIWWYAERGHISRAIGPFLKKRMQEEQVHVPIIEDHPVGDKLQRSHSARSRCAQGKILFPADAAWWPRAKAELLKFPNGRHDDFVDFLSTIGLKLQSHISAAASAKAKEDRPGSWGELKKQWAASDRGASARAARAGW